MQLHSSCIPVANSGCKSYLHWGKHSQAQKLSKQILIRCQVSMIDELANVSPNGNRICNWNLQLECNCRKLHRRICNWKNTRSGSPLFCSTTAELLVNEGFADTMLQVCLSTEWTQLVLLLFARRQVTSTLHEVRDKTNTFKSYKRPTWQAIVLNYIKTFRQFASIFLCFSSCIFLCAVAFQLHSSCKFQLQILFTLGEAFAGAKTKQTDPN